MSAIPEEELPNYELLRECLSAPILQTLGSAAAAGVSPRGKGARRDPGHKKNPSKVNATANTEDGEKGGTVASPAQEQEGDPDELSEFIDYIATEVFLALPAELRMNPPAAQAASTSLEEKFADAQAVEALVPGPVADSLTAYATFPTAAPAFLSAALFSYIDVVSSSAPAGVISEGGDGDPLYQSRADPRPEECELCERDWIPLTAHHLVPRSVAAKAIKRGWCSEGDERNLAWICRACHNFVHSMASNEELARNWHTIELIRGRDDAQRWARWVGRVRWRKC